MKTTDDEESTDRHPRRQVARRRADRLRPAARPLRPRVPRRHPAGHLDTPPGRRAVSTSRRSPWPPGWSRARTRPRRSDARALHARGHQPRPRALAAYARRTSSARSARRLDVRLRDVGNDGQRRLAGCARRRRRPVSDDADRRLRCRCTERTGDPVRPDRSRQDGVRVGSQAEAGRPKRRATTPGNARPKPERANPERANKERQSS